MSGEEERECRESLPPTASKVVDADAVVRSTESEWVEQGGVPYGVLP